MADEVPADEAQKPLVMVAIPTSGWVHSYVIEALLRLIFPDPRYSIHLAVETERPIENNRNRICLGFLRSAANWLLMIDDDNPPTCRPMDLIDLDLDIVGLPTQTNKHGKIGWNAYRRASDGRMKSLQRREGLEEVEAVGTGCILLSRRVVNAMRLAPPFQAVYDRRGCLTFGNDLNFCVRARALGFRVWTHWDYPCAHVSEVNLLELPRHTSQYLGD